MTEDNYTYNPLERRTYEAIAYNAVGRGSEINTYPAYGLVHSTGNSGWSVGIVQWDFGQPGRGQKVDELLDGYQAWAQQGQRFNDQEIDSLSRRLQTRGQVGNVLTADEQTRLNTYLRSDTGREFVDSLNREQIERKWDNVGQPLSQIGWLQRLSARDPEQAAEIVAMTSKLYNQNENKGGELVRHLQQNELSSDQTYRWIGNEGVQRLNPAATAAILSGRDGALGGIRLMNALETGDGQLSRAWRDTVHTNGNVGLTQNFNTDANVQLFDAMMRNPASGERIRAMTEDGVPAQRTVISGINALARQEIARTELSQQGVLTVRSPAGVENHLTPDGWVPAQQQQQGPPAPQRRPADEQDHMQPGRMPAAPPGRQGALDTAPPVGLPGNPTYERIRETVAADGRLSDVAIANVSASAYLAMASNPAVKQADHIGIYNGHVAVVHTPHGLGKEPMFNAYVNIAEAQNIPAQQSLQQAEQITQQRGLDQIRQQDQQMAQGQRTSGPSIGARVS
jgi:hypothetical protein